MSDSFSPATKQYILPFSKLSEKRKDPFTRDLEAAALFCIGEMERAKGGGLLVKQPVEKIGFISKIGYPLWFVPWNKTVLVFDGLNKSSYSLPYANVPDVGVFIENLRRSAKTRETHLAFLSDHVNYFQISGQEKSLMVSGLIKNDEFLGEFDLYRVEAEQIRDRNTQIGMLAHTIDESLVTSEVQELESLLSSFKEEVSLLQRSMKFLNKVTSHYTISFRSKMKAVKDEFGAKIKLEEETVTPRVRMVKDDYDARITEVTRSFDKQRLPIQKDRIRLEKAKEDTYEGIEKCKLEARSYAASEDKAGEQKCKEKSDRLKKELSVVESQLKQNQKASKDLEERRSLEIIKLRDELEARVKETRKSLLELEASRDAKILIYKQEMAKMEKLTKSIGDSIGGVIKLRESGIDSLGKLGVKRELGFGEKSLYYVSFYAVCYKAEMKKRYSVVPPSVVNTVGLATKFKGVLGKAKIKKLLVPRFKVVTSLMDTVQLLARDNAMFESEINELGEEFNILSSSAMIDEIKKGLSYLKNEGWLADKEYETTLQRLQPSETENAG